MRTWFSIRFVCVNDSLKYALGVHAGGCIVISSCGTVIEGSGQTACLIAAHSAVDTVRFELQTVSLSTCQASLTF